MSSEEKASGGPEDLIDLEEAAAVLPNINPLPVQHDSDNLLDSELPVLEQKLKSSSCVSLLDCHLPKNPNPVDVEDILITLDDNPAPEYVDNPTPDIACSVSVISELKRSSSAVLLELGYVDDSSLKRSLSCDNLEALNVLKELDDVLNASLEPSADEQAYNTVLLDLDKYLDGIDGEDSDVMVVSNPEEAFESTEDVESDPKRAKHPSSSLSAMNRSRPSVANFPCFRSLRKLPPSTDLGAVGIACDTGSVRPCGTVTPELQQGAESANSDSTSTSAMPKTDNTSSAWLRNSMRRLRHLPMPNDTVVDDGVPVGAPGPSASVASEPSASVGESVRPVSAPSVLVANSAGVNRGSGSRRSRRPRSLSSSESSFVSSVDTSPSCTPAPSLVHNGQSHQNGAGNTRR